MRRSALLALTTALLSGTSALACSQIAGCGLVPMIGAQSTPMNAPGMPNLQPSLPVRTAIKKQTVVTPSLTSSTSAVFSNPFGGVAGNAFEPPVGTIAGSTPMFTGAAARAYIPMMVPSGGLLTASELNGIHNHMYRYHGARSSGSGARPDELRLTVTWDVNPTGITDLDNHVRLPDGYGTYTPTLSPTPQRPDQPFYTATVDKQHIFSTNYNVSFNGGTSNARLSGEVGGGAPIPNIGCVGTTNPRCEQVRITKAPTGIYQQQTHNFDQNLIGNPANSYETRVRSEGRTAIQSVTVDGVNVMANPADGTYRINSSIATSGGRGPLVLVNVRENAVGHVGGVKLLSNLSVKTTGSNNVSASENAASGVSYYLYGLSSIAKHSYKGPLQLISENGKYIQASAIQNEVYPEQIAAVIFQEKYLGIGATIKDMLSFSIDFIKDGKIQNTGSYGIGEMQIGLVANINNIDTSKSGWDRKSFDLAMNDKIAIETLAKSISNNQQTAGMSLTLHAVGQMHNFGPKNYLENIKTEKGRETLKNARIPNRIVGNEESISSSMSANNIGVNSIFTQTINGYDIDPFNPWFDQGKYFLNQFRKSISESPR